jgi:excisionase family DNA binding protein
VARNADEPRPPDRRLLSPAEAATYLGLTSRFAIYRLVTAGELVALRLANKLRVDVRDLDAMIERAKAGGSRRGPAGRRGAVRAVPDRLAERPTRRTPVTPRVTAPRRPA